jgi:hypothetical protein
MPTPTYVNATNFLKGVKEDEAAIHIGSYKQSFEDPKIYIEDKAGSRTGFVHNFDPSSSCTITGETNVSSLASTMGVAFGIAETVANNISGFGVTTGSFFLEDIEFTQDRGALSECTANLLKITGLV